MFEDRRNVLVEVNCSHWVDIYERCQGWVVQEHRGGFAFEWRPVSLSFYVRLVFIKPTVVCSRVVVMLVPAILSDRTLSEQARTYLPSRLGRPGYVG